MLKEFLEGEGMLVELAQNGREALEKLHSLSFDLVLLDLRMPGVSGVEVLQEIKKEEPELPVVVITAYGSVDNAVETLKMGAFVFITKPFKLEELLNTISRALEVERLKERNNIFWRKCRTNSALKGSGQSPRMKRRTSSSLVAKTDTV